jgi:hypothetical protein
VQTGNWAHLFGAAALQEGLQAQLQQRQGGAAQVRPRSHTVPREPKNLILRAFEAAQGTFE